MSDQFYMDMALSLAQTAADLGETPVGCVIIDEATGEVVAGAANGPIGMNDPTAHAEILALRRAALGVIRIVVENGVRLGLSEKLIWHASLTRILDRGFKGHVEGWLADLLSHLQRGLEAIPRLERALQARADLPRALATLGVLRIRTGASRRR